MDRERLVQFALLGSSDLEQYAILLVRGGPHVFHPSLALGVSPRLVLMATSDGDQSFTHRSQSIPS